MLKYESILKQTEVFEKIAFYGDRKDFLTALAQNLSSGSVAFPTEDISSAVDAAVGSINNLVQMISSQEAASTPEYNELSTISNKLDNSKISSYVSDKQELDTKANPMKALLGNAMYTAMTVQKANENQEIKQSAQQLIDVSKKALTLINNFYRNNGLQIETSPSTSSPAAPVAQLAPQQHKKPQTSTDVPSVAKNLAGALEHSIEKLSTGPERTAQLKQINVMVKALQNYFTQLQKNSGLQGYFARMAIVSALQKAYSTLEYSDLDVVQSLNEGRGVPETPDSKIV